MKENYHIQISNCFPDQAWDSFLSTIPSGKIEQTSSWAKYKELEGWSGTRIKVLEGKTIVAGCQILSRPIKYFGKIAYIASGPVSLKNEPDSRVFLTRQIKTHCKSERIIALLASPVEHEWSDELTNQKFLPNYLKKVIEGDINIDLNTSISDIFQNIKPKKRQNIRRADKLGVSVRLGNTGDLATFFELMKKTCERRQKAPNPPDLDSLTKIWQLLDDQGQAVLFIAEHEQQPQAGLIGFNFSGALVLWKKGWSGSSKLKVNDFIIWEAMKWAKENGLKTFQDSGVNFEAVFSEDERAAMGLGAPRSSDLFKQSFGGEVELLPLSALFIHNRLFRTGYRFLAPLLRRPLVKRNHIQKLALTKIMQESP